MSEGWPEGWVVATSSAYLQRVGQASCVDVEAFSEGGYYATIASVACLTVGGAMEMARRAVWAMEPRNEIDREALALSLLRVQHGAWGSPQAPWEGYKLAYRDSWLSVADEAIRLLSGSEARVDRVERLSKIEDLEQRNATLTATANAAVERAEAAEGVLKFMEVEVTRMSRERDAATARAQKAEEMRDNLTSLQRRAEEAEVRAARAEKALKVANEDGAEVQRLRRALDAAARGAAHLTTAISEMTGGGDA